MLAGGFHDAENGAALLGHADPAFREMRLQTAGNFSLRQWHGRRLLSWQVVATDLRRNRSAMLDLLERFRHDHRCSPRCDSVANKPENFKSGIMGSLVATELHVRSVATRLHLDQYSLFFTGRAAYTPRIYRCTK